MFVSGLFVGLAASDAASGAWAWVVFDLVVAWCALAVAKSRTVARNILQWAILTGQTAVEREMAQFRVTNADVP